MGMMDKFKQMLKGHEDQADKAVDKGGDYIDQRTQGKHSGQVDSAQERMKDQYGRNDQGPGEPGQ
ncbi:MULTISPECIES: antitoxin [unclassified Streptomyces]|jgi:hypothetical protein|uniref:antitoxin n=1 Tax=unclassified Streptomyces TaxID=2593676 RepID=UPI0033A627B8